MKICIVPVMKYNIQSNYSYIEVVELLQHYIVKYKPNVTSSLVYMYERAYIRLYTMELADLCHWVKDMRNAHEMKANSIFTQHIMVEGITKNKFAYFLCIYSIYSIFLAPLLLTHLQCVLQNSQQRASGGRSGMG